MSRAPCDAPIYGPFVGLVGALLVLLASAHVSADTDCSVRESFRDDPKWKCLTASSFQGECIPSAAFQKWGCLELDSRASLCEDGGSFNMSVYLAHDGAALDCHDQIIDHQYRDGDPKYPGMRTPYSHSVSDIEIRNCTIQNTGRYGIDLKRLFRGPELVGAMAGHRNIRLNKVSIAHARQWGIYVGQNSRGVSIIEASIDDAYGGVYLEAGSAGTQLVDSVILNSHSREGLAIDSSADNVIEGCRFSGNSDAVNIYTNCGETSGQVCPISRVMAADRNVLRGNVFVGGDVHVAWRQFKLYGVGFCEKLGLLGYFRDRAADTFVLSNRFEGADLDIDDGSVVVQGNQFIHGARMELGATRPLLYSGDAVEISGVVADNLFSRADDLRLVSAGIYRELFLLSNRYGAGRCAGYNHCFPVRSVVSGAPTNRLVDPAADWQVSLNVSAHEFVSRAQKKPLLYRSPETGRWHGPSRLKLRGSSTALHHRYQRGRRLRGGGPCRNAKPPPLCTGCR